jgi:glutamate-1-semialdehyde 2,1-aminomutase
MIKRKQLSILEIVSITAFQVGCGGGIRTPDLRVMSPTSYQLLYSAIWDTNYGARGRTRTGTGFNPTDFKSGASANSATRAISIDFVRGVAELCKRYGALLIFDEVVTAFRLSPHGVQGIMGIEPDLTVFGKVIGGGYPGAGGVGGKEEYRKYLAAGIQTGDKVKKALVGGTMAATPLSALAGYYTIKLIQETKACDKANAMGDRLTAGLKQLIKKYDLPFVAFNQGSICHLETVGTMHFVVNWKKPWTIIKVLNETSVRKAEMEHMGAAYMAEGLVTLAGSRLYTSAAYNEEMIDQALAAFDRTFANVVRLDK